MRLTNSEMKQVQRCPRKWYFSTYRALQPVKRKDFNKPLSIGTRLHDALAEYYQPGDIRLDPMQYLDGTITRDIIEFPSLEEEIDKEGDLVRIMLQGYMDWLEEEGLDADIRVVEPEAELEVPLIDGVTLLSKVDAQVEEISTGKRGAIEHKSVGDLKKPVRKLQVDSQLLTEHLVQFLGENVKAPENRRTVEFTIYNMLRKVKRSAQAKPPFYGREIVRHNDEELRNHWRHCTGIAMRIQELRARLDAGVDHHVACPPNVTTDCSWDCDFAEPCLSGMIDDGSDIEGYLAEKYETHNPLERYVSEQSA